MTEPNTQTEAGLVAELNDLLQLDHDAVQAYGIAIDHLDRPEYRDTLEAFRGDHERHIRELSDLIRQHGGTPLELAHIPTGFFKAAVQRIGAATGARTLILTFKANERQVRDRYARAAEGSHPTEVAEVLRRAAEDERRHYDWAIRTAEELGVGGDTVAGRAEAMFEAGHKRAADVIEGAERGVMETVEAVRHGDVQAVLEQVKGQVRRHPIRSALVAGALGYVLGRVLR